MTESQIDVKENSFIYKLCPTTSPATWTAELEIGLQDILFMSIGTYNSILVRSGSYNSVSSLIANNNLL